MKNWENLFGTTSAWVGIVDSTGRLIWVNGAFERGSGHKADDLPFPAGPGGAPLAAMIGRAWLGHPPAPQVVPLTCLDGTTRQVCWSTMRIHGEEGPEATVVAVIGQLVGSPVPSDRPVPPPGERGSALDTRGLFQGKWREEEVLRQAVVVRHSGELISVADLDGRMLFLNETGSRILGIDPERAGDFNIRQVIPPQLRERVERELLPRIVAGECWEGELQYRNLQTGALTDVYSVAFPIVLPEVGGHNYLANVSHDITRRKQTERTLREREEQLRGITKNIPGLVFRFLVKNDGGFGVSYVSESAREVFGLAAGQDDLFQVFLAHVYEGDRAELLASIRAAAEACAPWQFEGRFVKPGGEVIWFHSRSSPLRCEEGLVYDGILLDITGRKQAELELQETLQRLHGIIEFLPDPAFVIDQAHVVVAWNKAMEELTGVKKEFMLGQGDYAYAVPLYRERRPILIDCFDVPAAELEDAYSYLKRVDHTVYGETYVADFREGPGVYLWGATSPLYDSSGRRVGAIEVIRDITERKLAEEKYRLSEEKFHKIFIMAPDLIAITRLADGLLADVNIGFEEIAGWQRSEIVGRTSIDIGFWAVPKERDLMVAELKAGRDVVHWEIAFRPKDGAVRTGVYSARLIQIAGESYILFVMQDVTGRKRLEAERQKLEQQLFQAQKLDAIGQLAGGVAHDFNNMLGVIIGNTEMAMEGVDPAAPVYKALQGVLNAGMRSADLTRQLLAFARKQVVSPRILDLNNTVTGMLKMLRRLIGESIDLVWRPGQDLWEIRIDPSQVDQLLANLVVNARDAIGKTGQITIETTNATCGAAVDLGVPDFIPGDYVQLAVSDDGCGMDRETQARIFEPFFTTKREGQGTGLGLATVYGIVKQNNGFIKLNSEPGRGATFRLFLPRSEAKNPKASDELDAMRVLGGTETILIVEDDDAMLGLGQGMLERLGYHVLAARETEQAIRLATEHAGPIDLLLTDVVMPGMNGLELAERLGTIRPGLKCLFMSGYTADMIARQGVVEEGIRLIVKPFSLRELAARVRDALA